MFREGAFVGFASRRCWFSNPIRLMAALTLVIVAGPASSFAATLCVNKTGTGGCFKTIQAAVDAVSSAGTTIDVAPGIYKASCTAAACSVASILSTATNAADLPRLKLKCRPLTGSSVVLNATGLDHAIYISGVNGVTVSGCVAENAAREGILVENADNVTVKNNEVKNNDEAMAATIGKGNPPCPTFVPPGTPGTSAILCCPDAFGGGPGNFPEDNDDCGEGVHLRGVTNSVVQGNSVHDNIGGILLTDETAPSSSNLIAGNNSSHNLKFGGDCGITLPSHTKCDPTSTDASGCLSPNPTTGFGVFHNAVVGNVLKNNGASGAGLFANPGAPPGAGTKAFGNLIAENVVENNGQPGIAIHVHAANGNADHNMIIENILSGNGGDAEAEGNSPPKTGIEVLSNGSFGGPFSAAAPIVGTLISQNKISDEGVDIWVGNTATNADAFLNDLKGAGKIGVQNDGTGTVTATDNWWGCPEGPGSGHSCSKVGGTGSASIVTSPFLHHPLSPED